MQIKKLLLFALCILVFGSFCSGKCEINPRIDNFLLDPGAHKEFPINLNSTWIVLGNVTSQNPNVDFNWTYPDNLPVNYRVGGSKALFNFSFMPEIPGEYNLTVFNKDTNNTANVTLFYKIQIVNESDFEASRIALMNNYSSQTTTHVGYILILIGSIATLFITKDRFRGQKNGTLFFMLLVLIFLCCLVFYQSLRMVYWSYLSSTIKVITITDIDLTRDKTVINALQSAAVSLLEGVHLSRYPLEVTALFFKKIGLIYSAAMLLVFSAIGAWIGVETQDWIRKNPKAISKWLEKQKS